MAKLRKLFLDDRYRLPLACAAAAVLLITAMLLPLAFRSTEGTEAAGVATAEAKRQLFADY